MHEVVGASRAALCSGWRRGVEWVSLKVVGQTAAERPAGVAMCQAVWKGLLWRERGASKGGAKERFGLGTQGGT